MESNLLIIIPAYNELGNIKKLYIDLKKKNLEIIIINDCSTDNTVNFLKKKKIQFLNNKEKLGYEKSLIRGFNYAISKKFKYILCMDGDGEHRVKYISKFITEYKRKNSDVIIGKRDIKPRFMEHIICKYFKIKYRVSDPLSGFVFYRTEVLKKLNLSKFGKSYHVDLLRSLIINKSKISEISIKIKKRKDLPRVGSNFNVNLKMIKIFFKNLF